MIEITADNVLEYLRSSGHIGSEAASATALGWGVSNVVLRIETANERFVLKQSRPQLRTRDLWLSDIERVYREQEVMELLGPILPDGVVPRVLWSDRPNCVFAMSHAPLESVVWKEALLNGEVDLALGEWAGAVLGQMHQATSERRKLLEPFTDRKVFVQLRVDPFYRKVQERCPDIAAAVQPLVDQLLSATDSLCHGDYSPKNILTHAGCFTLVDYETAHLGDPAMDLGFFLSHVVLKSLARPAQREQFFELTRAFWRGYAREVRFRPIEELQRRGIAHFGLCVLARIDGTSPVDYLTAEVERTTARQLGKRVLFERPATWEEVLSLLAACGFALQR